MATDYQIQVFGKKGCDKCKVLNDRIDNVLKKSEWNNFEKLYLDVETEDGIVAFSRSECINPQRIPAFLVTKRNDISGDYEPVENLHPGESDKVCKKSKLYSYLGCQTDYTETGKGIISPKMITKILSEALEQ